MFAARSAAAHGYIRESAGIRGYKRDGRREEPADFAAFLRQGRQNDDAPPLMRGRWRTYGKYLRRAQHAVPLLMPEPRNF